MRRKLLGIGLMIIGAMGIAVGEYDDAPGAGGLGMLLIAIGIYLIMRRKKIVEKVKKKR